VSIYDEDLIVSGYKSLRINKESLDMLLNSKSIAELPEGAYAPVRMDLRLARDRVDVAMKTVERYFPNIKEKAYERS